MSPETQSFETVTGELASTYSRIGASIGKLADELEAGALIAPVVETMRGIAAILERAADAALTDDL